jgi:hypothetical protein
VVAALLALLPLVSLVYDLTHFGDVLRRAAERTAASPTEVSQALSANRIVNGVALAVVLLTAAALFVPVRWLRRGNPVARVLSCVAGAGAALCCCTGYGLGMTGQSSPNGSDLQSEVSRLSVRETPAWVGLISLPAVLVAPLAITAVVLLLVPASNRFFRPQSAPAEQQPAPAEQQPSGGYYVYPAQWWGDQVGGQPGRPGGRPGGPPGGPPGAHPGASPGGSSPGPPPVDPRELPPNPPEGPGHPPDNPPRG